MAITSYTRIVRFFCLLSIYFIVCLVWYFFFVVISIQFVFNFLSIFLLICVKWLIIKYLIYLGNELNTSIISLLSYSRRTFITLKKNNNKKDMLESSNQPTTCVRKKTNQLDPKWNHVCERHKKNEVNFKIEIFIFTQSTKCYLYTKKLIYQSSIISMFATNPF